VNTEHRTVQFSFTVLVMRAYYTGSKCRNGFQLYQEINIHANNQLTSLFTQR